MPFIGQQPLTGAYSKLDSITTSATATYNLQLDGASYSPASANHLLVSLNGVMQAPQDSFIVSGSTITFASALTSSDNIDFIMALGDVLNIGTPTDGTVSTAKIANSAVTDAKIAGMSASKLTGAMPALDGSALTGAGTVKHMQFANIAFESCDLNIIWGGTSVRIPISTNVKDRLRAQVEKALSAEKVNPNAYYPAANFYYEWDKDMTKALNAATKATEVNQNGFWIFLLKAKIQRDMGDKVGAKASAEKCIELATTAKNDEYVKLGSELIKKL